MISKLDHLMETLVRVDERLGLKKLIKYILVIIIVLLLIPVAKDPKGSVKETVRFFLEISEEIERDKQEIRDEVIRELCPLLRELRAETDADRVVYYEYHNSIENEAGVPFKFVDLVQQAPRHGLPSLPPLDNINASRFAELYLDLIEYDCVINSGNPEFYYKYPGAQEISNGSVMQVYCNIPGVHSTLGLVVLEWYCIEDSTEINWPEITKLCRRECLRINALMSKLGNYDGVK